MTGACHSFSKKCLPVPKTGSPWLAEGQRAQQRSTPCHLVACDPYLISRSGPQFSSAAHVATQRGQQECQVLLDFTGALRTTLWGLLLQRAPSRCCASFAYLCTSLVPLASKVPASPSAGSLPSVIPLAAHGTSSHMLLGSRYVSL